MVTITEGSAGRDKGAYGLAVSVALAEHESLESDFYQIKDALLEWQRSRGRACGALSIEYQVAESSRHQVEGFWLAKINKDHLIRSVLGSIHDVELSLITPDGRSIKKIGFEFRHKQSAA